MEKDDILNFVFPRRARDGSELACDGLDLVNEDRDRFARIMMDVVELLAKGKASGAAILFIFGLESFPSGSTRIGIDDDGLVDGLDEEIKERICLPVHLFPESSSCSFLWLQGCDDVPISIYRKVDLNVLLECSPVLAVELCDAGKERDKPWCG